MFYPEVLDEDATLNTMLSGRSVARFGDGELRIAVGGHSASQKADVRLRAELIEILGKTTRSLVCIPTMTSAKPKNWAHYAHVVYTRMYRQKLYGSAFITRPDSAPHIDRPDYWERVRSIWRDKDVTLVAGSVRSLTPEKMPEARSVRFVEGTYRDSFSVLPRIEEQIGRPSGPVIICLGAAGTVLAERLARRGAWAMDLGHIGMMMKYEGQGRWSMKPNDLMTPEYRQLMIDEHAAGKWGNAGHHHVPDVVKLLQDTRSTSVLDYGCGGGTLKRELDKLGVDAREYDPGIPGKNNMPEPAHIVVCTDVLEHVEPGMVDNTLRHLNTLALKGMYLSIALSVGNKILLDGTPAHRTVKTAEWWLEKLRQACIPIRHHEMRKNLMVWSVK